MRNRTSFLLLSGLMTKQWISFFSKARVYRTDRCVCVTLWISQWTKTTNSIWKLFCLKSYSNMYLLMYVVSGLLNINKKVLNFSWRPNTNLHVKFFFTWYQRCLIQIIWIWFTGTVISFKFKGASRPYIWWIWIDVSLLFQYQKGEI